MNKKQKGYEKLPNGHITIDWVRELMQGKSEAEIQEAEKNFMNYVALMGKIAKRLEEQEEQGICHIQDHREGKDELNCEFCENIQIKTDTSDEDIAIERLLDGKLVL
jgi:hypothetical protein